jgi:hypothetical protein
MSNTVFVLMEQGWDYNDEVYFQPECGGGTPNKIYTSEKEALAEMKRRNLKSMKGLLISGEAFDYCNSIGDMFQFDSDQELNQVLQNLFKLDLESVENKLNDREPLTVNEQATDQDWAALEDKMTLSFWDVVECEGQ